MYVYLYVLKARNVRPDESRGWLPAKNVRPTSKKDKKKKKKSKKTITVHTPKPHAITRLDATMHYYRRSTKIKYIVSGW